MTALGQKTARPQSHYIPVSGREIHVVEWGQETDPCLLFWHGLARSSQEFEALAAHLSSHFRILCPDAPGRGLSQWAKDPLKEYHYDFFIEIADALLDHFQIEQIGWLGHGMGGHIGILAAGGPLQNRIRALALNDVAMVFTTDALKRVADYVEMPIAIARMEDFELIIRAIFMTCGEMEDDELRHLAQNFIRRRDDGLLTLHFDPKIAHALRDVQEDQNFWPNYEKLTCSCLVFRGEASQILSMEEALKFTQCGPKAELLTVPKAGHTPILNHSDMAVEALLKFYKTKL